MKDLSLLTWYEVMDIDKRKRIVFVVIAPIEEHGTHLPLATDIIDGEYWSKGAMCELERRLGTDCYYLPPFPVAAASVNEFYGSIHFPMKTVCDVTFAVLESICFMGFRNIIVIASHADPQHQIAVEKAVRKINKRHGLCAIAPMGQIFMGVSEGRSCRVEKMEKEHGNDFHAGWIETSSLLDIDPSYVREGYRELPDSAISDKDMIFRKRQLEAMGKYGYIGAPRFSSAELGKDLNNDCIASICDAAEKFFRRDGYQKYEHYSLYDILPLHLGFLPIAGRVRRRRVTG
ncbi:MAG: creatininase family protein [Ruminococcus sp.]|uniref:creatininase family protein n=1 Tax=Ruminococcus sp. TaxID=41978 RepID=UPI0025FC8CDC|nr:creatininase family protein [Ruminococcus sp.]MBO4866874.1 creatininase family protein [Ruminococcus sp.]